MKLSEIIETNRAAALGSYFRRVVTASVAAAAIGLGGCASQHGMEPANFEGAVCEDGRHQVVSGLMTPVDWEYLAAFTPEVRYLGHEPTEGSITHARGELCETAMDPDACEAEVGRSDFGARHIVVTAGDEVRRFVTHAEVMEFLGSVDTTQEALLLAWHAGYTVDCSEPDLARVREIPGGYEVFARRLTNDCPWEVTEYLLSVSEDGEIEVLSSEVVQQSPACAGRRPDAWIRTGERQDVPPVARYLASMAHLEAGAVLAFENLGRELEAHGAPRALIRDVEAAARDEVMHAELMTLLAKSRGVTPPEAEVSEVRVRSIYEMALDNATEGCVRETYGALVGTYQADAAKDLDLARVMRRIAEDETRHASLSWRIGDWLLEQLSDQQRADVRAAQRAAVEELRTEASVPPSPDLLEIVGLPPAKVAVAMVDRLAEDLWH